MNKRKLPNNNDDRLKLLLALMTKDYANVMKVGSSVLRQNPNDLSILRTLSAVKDKIAVNSLVESAGSDSDEDIPVEENMQTDCDTSDSDSDTDEETESDYQITIDGSEYRESTMPAKNLSDRVKTCLFSCIGKEGMEEYGFKEKIYRILVVKTKEKSTSRA